MIEKLKEIRGKLYAVNSQNISMEMIAMKNRDDKVVYDTNESIGHIIEELDKLIEGES